MSIRWILLALALVAFSAQGQLAGGPAADSREVRSAPSRPSVASTPSTAGAPMTVAPPPTAGVDRPPTVLLGSGSFGPASGGAGLEGALNSGSPPMYQRRAGPRKVCPPGLENRDNVCVAPVGSILSN